MSDRILLELNIIEIIFKNVNALLFKYLQPNDNQLYILNKSNDDICWFWCSRSLVNYNIEYVEERCPTQRFQTEIHPSQRFYLLSRY